MTEVHLAPILFHRGLPPEELKSAIDGGFAKVATHTTLAAAIETAVESGGASDLVLVAGSFYLVGEAIRFFDSPLS